MRILAVADVYEALTSERPYRPARTSDHALEIMRADVPARLDAEAFAALEDLLEGGVARRGRRIGARPDVKRGRAGS